MATSRRDASAPARELTAIVTRLRRALRRSIRTDYPWESRPVAQVEVLQSLRDTGPVRLGELAARLNLAQSTVSALVSALAADDLVERSVDQQDRRAALVALAADGVTYLSDWDAAHRRRIGRALRELRPADRARVVAALPALDLLVDALNRDAERAR